VVNSTVGDVKGVNERDEVRWALLDESLSRLLVRSEICCCCVCSRISVFVWILEPADFVIVIVCVRTNIDLRPVD